MKNPHGVKPTRYLKRKESVYAIGCCTINGPIFGECMNRDLIIRDQCNKENSCFIYNDGEGAYECHPEYKSSLFVNTAGPNEENMFSVLDYEVYCIDNYKDFIYNVCKYPDIIWNYVRTNNISNQLLQLYNSEDEIINDLNTIHFYDSHIRLKISQYYLKNPSELLPDTQIVSQQYDSYLREWVGDYKWKLLYRASEHKYTAKSFHKYCDDKGPTLIIIKSSEGWIFGGYTTQSWSGWGIYNDMIY